MFEKLNIFFEPSGPEVGREVLSPEAKADAKMNEAFGENPEQLSADEQAEKMKNEGLVYTRGKIKDKTEDVMNVLKTMHQADKLDRSWVAGKLVESAQDFSKTVDQSREAGIFRKTYEIPVGEDLWQTITLKYDPDKPKTPEDKRYTLHFGNEA